MSKRIAIGIIAVIILVVLALILLPNTGQAPTNGSGTNTSGDVPVMQEYAKKVVYTTDRSLDAAPLQADCTERGGTFQDCGSPCAPDADMCTQVCAYTCQLK